LERPNIVATKLPTFDQLMNPLLRGLRALGGSGSVDEIYDKVVELERFPDEVISQPHDPDKSNQTEVAYRLAWARTYLKKFGLLENSSRGIWSLTSNAKEVDNLNPQDVVRAVRALDKKEAGTVEAVSVAPSEISQEEEWKQKLHRILTQKLSPAAFERLVQRLLRESGFKHVEITGRSGDGGIDAALLKSMAL
jgi:restriction system protein